MLNCRSVQFSISEHLDGTLSGAERREFEMHLEGCRECELRLAQQARIRSGLKRMARAVPPPELTANLKVLASRERARRIAWLQPAEYLQTRFQLWAGNLVRPWALPFAGGLVSAMLLFSMVMPGIALRFNPRLNDVSLGLFTEPTVKEQAPFGFNDDPFMVDVSIDSQGRAVDFSIRQGPDPDKTPGLRRMIGNYLLFTEFNPATNALGRPVSGKLSLSFNRFHINVPANRS